MSVYLFSSDAEAARRFADERSSRNGAVVVLGLEAIKGHRPDRRDLIV